MKRTLKIWLLVLPLVFLSTKCETGGYQIPYVRVDLHLNIVGELGNPANGSWKLVDGGVHGLIVYREDFDLFHVYDRICTEYPEHIDTVAPDPEFTGVFTCPECESRYMLLNGAEPFSGPATFGLHEYYSVVEGDLLHIYN